jgi:hypothetical protein
VMCRRGCTCRTLICTSCKLASGVGSPLTPLAFLAFSGYTLTCINFGLQLVSALHREIMAGSQNDASLNSTSEAETQSGEDVVSWGTGNASPLPSVDNETDVRSDG